MNFSLIQLFRLIQISSSEAENNNSEREWNLFSMVQRLILALVALFAAGGLADGISVATLADCAANHLLLKHGTVATIGSDKLDSTCEQIVSLEIVKFYEYIRNWITSRIGDENLANGHIKDYEKCIVKTLLHYNVTDIFLKGIANKYRHGDHTNIDTVSLWRGSEQILWNALQFCEPKTIYVFVNFNMPITNAKANCLLAHLNANSVEPYQFSNNTDSNDGIDCGKEVATFIRQYYNLLDLKRGISVFDLRNTAKVKDCRRSKDKNLIDNIILLSIFSKLKMTDNRREQEKARFFKIARDQAEHFFECINLFDWILGNQRLEFFKEFVCSIESLSVVLMLKLFLLCFWVKCLSCRFLQFAEINQPWKMY